MPGEVWLVVAFIVIYWELLWPYVVYPLQSWQRGCGRVKTLSSVPFGLPGTIRVVRNLLADQIMRRNAERDLGLGHVKTYWLESFFKWMVVTREPENVKAMLATQFADFSLASRSASLIPVFGSGIFTQDGSEWKHSRTMLRPQFSKEQISRLDGTARHTDRLIAQLRARRTVEAQQWFHMLTMDTATEFLFGESTNSLEEYRTAKSEAGGVSPAAFVESYTYLLKLAVRRIVFNNQRLFTEGWGGARVHLQRAHAFIDHYVERALATVRADAVPDNSYVFSYELAKLTDDPQVIRDEIFNILIAGRDTTASTLSYAFYYFVKHPELWDRVRADVWQAFPAGSSTEYTFEGLRRLTYVPLFVKEVLRLSPAVPFNVRTAVRDTKLPKGGGTDQQQPVFVPKGTSLFYSTYTIHRDPDIFGPTAREFDPDRWLDLKSVAWGYIPFNGGPRICLGQQFALTELYLVICKLAHAFTRIEPGPGFPKELRERQTLTASVGGSGVPVTFTT